MSLICQMPSIKSKGWYIFVLLVTFLSKWASRVLSPAPFSPKFCLFASCENVDSVSFLPAVHV